MTKDEIEKLKCEYLAFVSQSHRYTAAWLIVEVFINFFAVILGVSFIAFCGYMIGRL